MHKRRREAKREYLTCILIIALLFNWLFFPASYSLVNFSEIGNYMSIGNHKKMSHSNVIVKIAKFQEIQLSLIVFPPEVLAWFKITITIKNVHALPKLLHFLIFQNISRPRKHILRFWILNLKPWVHNTKKWAFWWIAKLLHIKSIVERK